MSALLMLSAAVAWYVACLAIKKDGNTAVETYNVGVSLVLELVAFFVFAAAGICGAINKT
jgi:hypothetical protein